MSAVISLERYRADRQETPVVATFRDKMAALLQPKAKTPPDPELGEWFADFWAEIAAEQPEPPPDPELERWLARLDALFDDPELRVEIEAAHDEELRLKVEEWRREAEELAQQRADADLMRLEMLAEEAGITAEQYGRREFEAQLAEEAAEAKWRAEERRRINALCERRDALVKKLAHLNRKAYAEFNYSRKTQLCIEMEVLRQELLGLPEYLNISGRPCDPLDAVERGYRYRLQSASRKHQEFLRERGNKGATASAKLDANEQSKCDRVLRAIDQLAGKDGWAIYVDVYRKAQQRNEKTAAFLERIQTYPVEIRDNPVGKGKQVRRVTTQ